MKSHNSIKSLHEISIQRRIESGKHILPKEDQLGPIQLPAPSFKKLTSIRIKSGKIDKNALKANNQINPSNSNLKQDNQELYLEKLITESTRAAPLTKKMINEWDLELSDIKKWRLKEEEDFQKQLRDIEEQNLKLLQKNQQKMKDHEQDLTSWSNNIIKFAEQNKATYEKLKAENLKDFETRNQQPQGSLFLKKQPGQEGVASTVKSGVGLGVEETGVISEKINKSEWALHNLDKKKEVGSWSFGLEKILSNMKTGVGASETGGSGGVSRGYSLGEGVYGMRGSLSKINASVKGAGESADEASKLDDCLKDLESEFDEIEQMMKDCGIKLDEDDDFK